MLLSFDAKQKLRLSVTRNKEYLSKYLLEEERVVGAMLDSKKLLPEGEGRYKYTVTSFKVFQLDINPVVSGHLLLIPKKHYATFLDIPKEIYNNFMELAHDAVLKTLEETGAKGYNLVMNNDEVAGQAVSHSHLQCSTSYQYELHLFLDDLF